MPYLMNSLPTPVNVKAFGNWYSFTPGQIKLIHSDSVAVFLMEKRGEDGIVGISDEEMELKAEKPDEFKAAVERKRMDGIQKRLIKLESIKNNLLQSLSTDMKKANDTSDPLMQASKGEKEALRELKSLRQVAEEAGASDIEEIRKLAQELSSADPK